MMIISEWIFPHSWWAVGICREKRSHSVCRVLVLYDTRLPARLLLLFHFPVCISGPSHCVPTGVLRHPGKPLVFSDPSWMQTPPSRSRCALLYPSSSSPSARGHSTRHVSGNFSVGLESSVPGFLSPGTTDVRGWVVLHVEAVEREGCLQPGRRGAASLASAGSTAAGPPQV